MHKDVLRLYVIIYKNTTEGDNSVRLPEIERDEPGAWESPIKPILWQFLCMYLLTIFFHRQVYCGLISFSAFTNLCFDEYFGHTTVFTLGHTSDLGVPFQNLELDSRALLCVKIVTERATLHTDL